MAKERILVTGCAGFIGGHMMERLLAEEYAVSGVDDFSTGSVENLEPYRDRIRFVQGSLVEPRVAAEAVKDTDRIIHLASVPSVPRSVDNPLESAQASIIATINLLNAARDAGVKRVVQAASSSAYGGSPGLPRVETQLPDPLSPYAVAKLTQEYYGLAFYNCYGLDSISLRYFNVFGPRQNPNGDYAAVIPKFITMMLAGERPVIFGDGMQTRDFTYVGNVVDANLRAALCPEPLRGAVANIGNGLPVTLNELVAILNSILGTELEPVYQPVRSGDVLHSHADTERAEKLFGFKQSVGLVEGLARTLEYFRNLP